MKKEVNVLKKYLKMGISGRRGRFLFLSYQFLKRELCDSLKCRRAVRIPPL
jgi:hypothetical protein